MTPHVVLERRHVEVAHQDGARMRRGSELRADAHLVEKRQLVGEFGVDPGIGLVAARRHVKIMDRERVAQAGAFAQNRRDVPAIASLAEDPHAGLVERQPGKHGDPVIALLAVEGRMHVAQSGESFQRKFLVRTFGLLQAQHVRAKRLDESRHLIDAQPHRIDVPGRNRDSHGKIGVDPSRYRHSRPQRRSRPTAIPARN